MKNLVACTRFDRNFLPKAIVTLNSFNEYNPRVVVYAVCLDEYSLGIMKRLELKNVTLISLSDLEGDDPKLLKVKSERGLFEFYWSLTPSIIGYVQRKSGADKVLYIDSDMQFFSSIKPALQEMVGGHILTVEHRYPIGQEERNNTSGRFNVAFQIFDKSDESCQCLARWRNQCLSDTRLDPEGGVVGDQMYLNEWPNLYPNLVISKHLGIDLAPWNVNQYEITKLENQIHVNDQRLICYHYHQFEIYNNDRMVRSHGYYLNQAVVKNIYQPYEALIKNAFVTIRSIEPNYFVSLRPRAKMTIISVLLKTLAPLYWRLKSLVTRPSFNKVLSNFGSNPVVLQINSEDSGGGANQVVRQIHNELSDRFTTLMLVENRRSFDPRVFQFSEDHNNFYRWYFYFSSVGSEMVGLQYKGAKYLLNRDYRFLSKHPAYQKADIVHLHNLHGNYFDLDVLPQVCKEKKVVWTLQDCWAITGHCPIVVDCNRWSSGQCKSDCNHHTCQIPILFDTYDLFLSKKADLYSRSDFQLVTASHWLAKMVSKSILKNHPVKVIHNGADTRIFRPQNKDLARRILNLPTNRRIFLFAANFGLDNPWKGGKFISELVNHPDMSDVLFVTLGNAKESRGDRAWNLPFITDRNIMSTYYNSADVFLYPSLADTCPLTVIESMACGTPVVSFSTGGIPEIITHKSDGYLDATKSTRGLLNGIEYLFSGSNRYQNIRSNAVKKIKESFSLDLMISKYSKIYSDLLQS